ncbi:hypothetical protein ACFQYP_21065 [Nonomuraea antimicrobica]
MIGFLAGVLTVVFLASAPTIAPEATLAIGLAVTLVLGLTFVLVFGIMLGLVEWAEHPARMSSSTPSSSWRSDQALTLLRMLTIGLPVGLTAGLVAGVLLTGLVTGLTVGVVTGLLFGLLVGEHRAWLACTVASGRIALTRQLPWQIMPFLDDAHRLGLLRAVGPVYQFRHAVLHDHLATAPLP